MAAMFLSYIDPLYLGEAMSHLKWMWQAITLARSVEGRTSPRPPVGAVLVRDTQVIGRGTTSPPYGPHAEIHALREAAAAFQAFAEDVLIEGEVCYPGRENNPGR